MFALALTKWPRITPVEIAWWESAGTYPASRLLAEWAEVADALRPRLGSCVGGWLMRWQVRLVANEALDVFHTTSQCAK